MAAAHQEVCVPHGGPPPQHIQSTHDVLTCSEAASGAAARFSGSWEKVAVNVEAVNRWSVKHQDGRDEQRAGKTSKNKLMGATYSEADNGARDCGLVTVFIGPLCKDERSFPLRAVILSEQFFSFFCGWTATTYLAHMCRTEDQKRLHNFPKPCSGPELWPPDSFPQRPEAKTIMLEAQESQHMPPTHPSSSNHRILSALSWLKKKKRKNKNTTDGV